MIGYYFYKVMSSILKKHSILINYFRRGGVHIGDNCLICSNVKGPEASLIWIGNNTTVSTNVSFITHDFSAHLIFKGKSNLYGEIRIGNNCFIGANSTILYGVELADNTIVAAGSVVTKSVHISNTIIGGNPAKVISNWDDYYNKYLQNAASRCDLLDNDKKKKILIKR